MKLRKDKRRDKLQFGADSAHRRAMPDDSPALFSKRDLRRQMRDALRSVPDDEKQSRSRSLLQHLRADNAWAPAAGGVVSLFGGLVEEPDLLPLIGWLHSRGARTAFFALAGSELLPREVKSPDDLRRGALGIWEPHPEKAPLLPLGSLSCILTPALAFGQSDGSRIGRGAGFYDRLFGHPEVAASRIGIAFDLQIVPHIPTEPHDARVHAIVTESGWIRF